MVWFFNLFGLTSRFEIQFSILSAGHVRVRPFFKNRTSELKLILFVAWLRATDWVLCPMGSRIQCWVESKQSRWSSSKKGLRFCYIPRRRGRLGVYWIGQGRHWNRARSTALGPCCLLHAPTKQFRHGEIESRPGDEPTVVGTGITSANSANNSRLEIAITIDKSWNEQSGTK